MKNLQTSINKICVKIVCHCHSRKTCLNLCGYLKIKCNINCIMSVENKDEVALSPVNEGTINQADQKTVVSISQDKVSALQDALFEHVREKAKNWLSLPKVALGKEMDSVYFNEDRFELMIDTRGYKPEDVRCTVGPNTVEVVAQRQDVSTTAQRCMATSRSYQLPQNVLPQQAVCCLSTEGILLVAVPWQK